MRNRIWELIPDPDALLALQPEELAGYILKYLNSLPQNRISRHGYSMRSTVEGYPRNRQRECQYALMEAWAYLEREGLVARQPETDAAGEWRFVTRRGREIKTLADLEALRHASLFPRDSIHEEIAKRVYPLFLRAEYETAIFQAFKTVEVRVRAASGLDPTAYGVSLMRTAFHPDDGPLTDKTEPKAEQEALQHLFAGAIGRFKNPSSHRHVPITDPAETVEILQFASHLLRIVDDRANS